MFKLALVIYMAAATVFFACCALVLLSAGCTDNGSWTYKQDGNYGPAWWDDKANAPHVSESAPEALKPYYDPELTEALNH